MDRQIIERLSTIVRREGLDAIIAISPENVTYVSGFVVPSQSLMRWRHAICIVTADARVSMVAIDMEATTVRAHAGIDDLRIYREFTDDPMDKLADALSDLELDRSNVGIEMEFIPARDFATVQKRLPGISWTAADALFNKARQVKTAGELDLLRALSKLTDRAIGDTLRRARVGMTELELAGHLLTALFGGGAESYKLMIIASGERSEFPNVGPTDRKLKRGRSHPDGNFWTEERIPRGHLPHGGGRRGDRGAGENLVQLDPMQISRDGYDQARSTVQSDL